MQTKMISTAVVLVVLACVPSLVAGGYISPLALSAHPVHVPIAHVVPAPVIIKAPIATSYQSFTKVDRPALVAYSPAIVKAPIAYTTIVKPAVHYSAPLPISYHGLHGLHGLHSYPSYGYSHHGYPGYFR